MLASDLRFFEYSRAATPNLELIPFAVFPPEVADGQSRRTHWDLRGVLGCSWPATSPALLAGHVVVVPKASLILSDRCTSTLLRFSQGRGRIQVEPKAGPVQSVAWEEGDVLVIPGPARISIDAVEPAVGVFVNDEPLLRYLGADPIEPRFELAHYPRTVIDAHITAFRADPEAATRNRLGAILGQAATDQTKTVTHTLWALFNCLPAGVVQKPHRHNSVAIDVAVAAQPGTYTLMAPKIKEDGTLIDPIRADWVAGAAFVTPPGWWHSHHNETGTDAYVFPLQDAGLHTWLRTLDIQFVR